MSFGGGSSTFTGTIGSVDINGPTMSTVTSVVASVTTVTLLTANVTRKLATIYNDSTADLYVKFGSAASSTSFTVKIPGSAIYEFPLPCWLGLVTGVWTTANGAARITELS